MLAIGNPFGLDRTLTTGVVSALQRQITAPNGFTIQHVIQTDAPINPGNSGGPLLDAAGRVIGINSQIITGGTGNGNVGIGFAVPINTAKKLLPQLKQSGSVVHAYLGITGATIDASLADLQLKVDKGVLDPDGRAGRAGVEGGPARRHDREPARRRADHARRRRDPDVRRQRGRLDERSDRRHRPAQSRATAMRLEVLRSGKPKQVTVTLGTAPRQAPVAVADPVAVAAIYDEGVSDHAPTSRIKFCGITRLQDAEHAAELGAWAVGMILWPGSARRCSRAEAEAIGAALHRRTEVAGVFVNAHLDQVAEAADAFGLTLLQLHGDEGPVVLRRGRAPHRREGDQGRARRRALGHPRPARLPDRLPPARRVRAGRAGRDRRDVRLGARERASARPSR